MGSLLIIKYDLKSLMKRVGEGGLHDYTSLCFSPSCRESDHQAWGHLPVGARRRAMVNGTSISSSRHLSRWEQAPGGREEPSSKPTFWEKGWGHEAFTSSDSITVPSKELHPLYYFQSKDSHLLNKVAIFVCCSFPPYLSYYMLSLLSKKTSHSFLNFYCFLIFYCKTCIL